MSLAVFETPLTLDAGGTLPNFSIRYETYGTWRGDNAILVCHPLSHGVHAAATPDDPRPGWWNDAIGAGRMLDTDRWFVISSNVLGGCHGSSGPSSVNPATDQPYALDFPIVTIRDMVRAQRRLCDFLGVGRLHAVIGGCMGGQQVLEWAIRYPGRVERAVVIGATAATSAHSIAIFHVMRRFIRLDPNWNGGRYYGGPVPLEGLANAMVTAVPLWMSHAAMEQKFGRRPARDEGPGWSLGSEFAVEAYLDDLATRVAALMDPNSILYLTRAVEYFDLAREYGSLEQAVKSVQANVLLLSYRTDWRYPSVEIERLRETFETVGVCARHEVLHSPHGHGAFRFDVPSCAPAVRAFIETPVTALA